MSAAHGIRPAHSAGFTLLELLVAMFIAAVIFAMGYGAINQAVKSRVELQEQQAKLLELQTAVRMLEQDFVQLAQRPIREPVGSTATYQPALISSTTTQPFVALTRAGWTNPTGLQRSALQRVAYYFENGTLRRDYWTVLDPTQTSPTVRRELLTHLKSVSLRFLDRGGAGTGTSQNWQPQWPPPNNANQNDDRYRPIAVEITLETEDWGKVVRVVEIAG
ncbi:MAG: type II secretion system minor pseudopilin GspJ [Steroidobacteraceae bacterium]